MGSSVTALCLILCGIMFALMWIEDVLEERHRHKEAMKQLYEEEHD